MAAPTKPKKKKPPKAAPRKDNPVNAEYESQAKAALKYALTLRNADYSALAANLNAIGVEISAKGLENKISRGGFSAAFFLQCMEALELNLTPAKR